MNYITIKIMLEQIFKRENKMPKLAIVVPCYNEQEALLTTATRLLEVLDELEKAELISKKSFLFFVDDGSGDNTFDVISKLHKDNKKIKGLKFSKNFGNQNAILAGLNSVREIGVECAVTIDADLQQDENVIKDFILEFQSGNDLVFGIRKQYKKTNWFKKFSSAIFYKTMNLLGANITPNHSEYRLVGKKALDVLSQYGEFNLFLRGVFNEIGLKRAYVPYSIKPRMVGKTKFNWASLVGLALNGITSFSIVPLRFVAILGFLMALFSFGLGIQVVYEKLILDRWAFPGWATTVVAICFFAGVQTFCLGIIGEYLGQVYNEVKARPRYIKEIELV